MSTPQTLAGLQAGQYTGAKKLKLSSDDLTSFPSEILSLASTLEILDLSGNASLSSLPSSFAELTNLKIAFFSNCSFKTFPAVLAQCANLEMVAFKSNGMTEIAEDGLPKKLRWLILTGNEIETLPRSIGDCERLEKCMLAGNKLAALPVEMARCQKLGLLRLSCNRFESLPEWLWEMPELAFLSWAGNPVLDGKQESASVNQEVKIQSLDEDNDQIIADHKQELETIPFSSLKIQHLLGAGASGTISQGLWTRPSPSAFNTSSLPPSLSSSLNPTPNTTLPNTPAPTTPSTPLKPTASQSTIAIKIFHGALTSDGSPLDELASCIAAGKHANLISPLGTITQHPSSSAGLVLELIPRSYGNLGLPPNFDTCTRDTFTDDVTTRMHPRACVGILKGIAAAARHLHARGVAHGDLYAHNILVDFERGHAVLGDLGAATVYGRGREGSRHREEKVEVLAFGHLVQDLVGLVGKWDAGSRQKEALESLWERCVDRVVGRRPGFEEVVRSLEDISAVDAGVVAV